MKQEYFGFGLVALALIGGLALAKYAASDTNTASTAAPVIVLGQAQIDDIFIDQLWVAETIGEQNRSAAYFQVHNLSGSEERLVGASVAGPIRASLHVTRTENNVTSMQAIDGLIIRSGVTVALAPGGIHVMITNLEQPLRPGDRVILTLQFLEAGDLRLEAPVVSRADMMDHTGH